MISWVTGDILNNSITRSLLAVAWHQGDSETAFRERSDYRGQALHRGGSLGCEEP